MAQGPDPQRWWFWLPALTLIIGVVITAALADISHHVYNRNESHILELRARDAASVLTEALPDIQTSLASAAELADATGGNVAKFTMFVAPYVAAGGQHEFASVSLWRLGDLTRGPIATVGPRPELSAARAPGLFAPARPGREVDVIAFLKGPDRRLGYGYATPSRDGGYVVYAESPLPTDRRARITGNSAFAGLGYALYLGRNATAGQLLLMSAGATLQGNHATVRVPFGDTALTLELFSQSSLTGTLPRDLPWIILISGLVLTLTAALGATRLNQRRRVAERLAGDNRRLYAEQRSIAQTLQHALLPDHLPSIAGVEIAARYEAGERSVDIGGDWYDVISRPGDRLLLVVGDVSGRGLRAATTMASLRYAIRAYAAQNDDPPTILGKLSRLLNIADDHQLATVLCVELSVNGQELAVTTAGHLPPLLIGPDGATYIDVDVGLPVGVQAGARYRSTTVSVTRGATLLAFTDGLVERRGESLDDGMGRLAHMAAQASKNEALVTMLENLVTNLADDRAHDDIAVVGMRWTE